jgi:hypothetical protein
MSRRWVLARCMIVIALCAAPGAAFADESTDKAAAEALYQLGRRLIDQGQFAEACPKLEASEELDPGVGTLLVLGDCQEKLGKLASAWSSFQAAAALARARSDAERAGVADLRASALKPRLSFVSFDAAPNADLAGFELRRSGHVVARAAWGVSLPTDPGSYELTASAPGRETWHSTLSVPPDASEPLVVHVPRLAEPASANLAAPPMPTGSPPSLTEHPSSPQKVVGAVALGVGIAAAITGGVLTYVAWKKNHDSLGNCEHDNSNLCNPSGVTQRSDARKFANIATFVGIGAAVAVGGGTLLLLTAPLSEHGPASGLTLGYRSTF